MLKIKKYAISHTDLRFKMTEICVATECSRGKDQEESVEDRF